MQLRLVCLSWIQSIGLLKLSGLILIFTVLYISIAKFYLPKIKNNLDDRENKIKDDLDDANKFKELSEAKFKEYEKILEDAKKEVIKIHIRPKKFTR